MYFRQISGDGIHFDFPLGASYTLAFSRILYGAEVMVAYNVSAQNRNDCIIIDASIRKKGDKRSFLYGGCGTTTVQQAPDGSLYIQPNLSPHQFVVLQ